MLNRGQIFFIASLTVGLGFGMHAVTMEHIERKTEIHQQNINRKHVVTELSEKVDKMRGISIKNSGPTAEDVQNMLKNLEGKTVREKLETAVHAAHKAHDIGFPTSEEKSR